MNERKKDDYAFIVAVWWSLKCEYMFMSSTGYPITLGSPETEMIQLMFGSIK